MSTEDLRGPKERAYDEHFHPLVATLIALAKEHRITMLAHFEFDHEDNAGAKSCTTSLPQPEDEALAVRFISTVRPARASVVAVTIFTPGSTGN
jgi:hypothetical protein